MSALVVVTPLADALGRLALNTNKLFFHSESGNLAQPYWLPKGALVASISTSEKNLLLKREGEKFNRRWMIGTALMHLTLSLSLSARQKDNKDRDQDPHPNNDLMRERGDALLI